MAKLCFNINNYVGVQLTEEGEKLYEKYWRQNFQKEPSTNKKNSNGQREFQLWELMLIFGHHCGCGRPDCIKNANIYLNVSDLMESS